jgi:hypothetical protein
MQGHYGHYAGTTITTCNAKKCVVPFVVLSGLCDLSSINAGSLHLVRGGIYFVSGERNLRLIQQREKFLFFPAGNINMMIVGQYNITTLTFDIFLYVPEVDEIGMVHPAKS